MELWERDDTRSAEVIKPNQTNMGKLFYLWDTQVNNESLKTEANNVAFKTIKLCDKASRFVAQKH